jgi:hypothetical protein
MIFLALASMSAAELEAHLGISQLVSPVMTCAINLWDSKEHQPHPTTPAPQQEKSDSAVSLE